MSFYGKKYKKVDYENIVAFLDAMNVGEKTRKLLHQTDSVTVFEKNEDGSIQYTNAVDGNVLLNQRIELGKELDFKTPEGETMKVLMTLEGDTLKSVSKMPDGRTVLMDREFKDDKMKMTLHLEGSDLKAIVHYQTV